MARLRQRNPDLHRTLEPSLMHVIPASVTDRLEGLAVDLRIARVASRQESLVTRAQLTQLGLTRAAIEHRLLTGRLHRVHSGVLLAGPPPLSLRGRLAAALLACGPAAVVSHVSALWLWELGPLQGLVHLTLPGPHRQRLPGIVTHTSGNLAPEDLGVRRGLPVTAPARTLIDVASGSSARELQRLADELLVRKALTHQTLADAVERNRRRRGTARLRAVVAGGVAPTRSSAERRLLELIRASGLPRPLVNSRIAGMEVDLHWPAARVVVEVDGFAFHGTRTAFERDRRRDSELQAHGWRVVRLTWRRIVDEPELVVALLRRMVEPSPMLAERA